MSAIVVDTGGLENALKRYGAVCSKTWPQVLNGKSKDLAFRAAQATPLTKASAADHKKLMRSPEYVTFRTVKKHGKGFSIAQRQEVAAALDKTKLGKGYMKSGYAKAGQAFKNVGDASRIRAEARADPSQPSKARVIQATPNLLAAVSQVTWKAKGQGDASEKQGIVSPALAKAAAHVVADIEGYLAKKMGAEAKKVSA